MQFVYKDPKIFQRQQWRRFWPTLFLGIIAISQMLLTFAIISLETWSMILNIKYSFLFIGYIAAFFFTITWISTFTVVCCNRESQRCATHALIENILSIIASCVLLSFDARFLRDFGECLWPDDICDDDDDGDFKSTWRDDFDSDISKAKLIAIKIQLSCATVMLALSVLFILIYIYTSLKVRARSTSFDSQAINELRHPQPPSAAPIPVSSERPSPSAPQRNMWPPPTPPPSYDSIDV